jgi:hypothetical protein
MGWIRGDPGSESRDPGYVIQNLGSEIRKNLIPEPGVKKSARSATLVFGKATSKSLKRAKLRYMGRSK